MFLLSSCADSWDSVKSGLTGAKRRSADEFLVKKKDPLTLPPNFENLPAPGDDVAAKQEISVLEQSLEQAVDEEKNISKSTTTEKAILNRIKKQ